MLVLKVQRIFQEDFFSLTFQFWVSHQFPKFISTAHTKNPLIDSTDGQNLIFALLSNITAIFLSQYIIVILILEIDKIMIRSQLISIFIDRCFFKISLVLWNLLPLTVASNTYLYLCIPFGSSRKWTTWVWGFHMVVNEPIKNLEILSRPICDKITVADR